MASQRQFTPTDESAAARQRGEAERENQGDTLVDEARRPGAVREAAMGGPEEAIRGPQVESASYLPEETTEVARERWEHIQAHFVDDPRKSVGEAHQLVGELVQRIVERFGQERDDLERQWSQGDDVSTEDLRICLQSYRAFFSRLLPSMNGLKAREG